MTKKTIRDIEVAGKLVLVRVDYNVPIQDGQVGDTLRIEASFPTLRYLLEQNCRLVLISHLGEPKGPDQALSLAPVAQRAGELLGVPMAFVADCVGPEVSAKVQQLKAGEILLLENLRFHAGETAGEPEFARQLAAWGEVYVDDAFAAAHRDHASITGVAQHLPAVAGLLLEREVDTITRALDDPKRPLLAVVGGAKISSKIEVIGNLLTKVQALLIGGAMANTFLKVAGYNVGQSLVEDGQDETVNKIQSQAKAHGVQLYLPVDLVVTTDIKQASDVRTVGLSAVGDRDIIADVGPQSVAQVDDILAQGGTVIWNGPLGVTEQPAFCAGSQALADKVIASGAMSLVGGGDTAAFVDATGLHDKFGFVSTGGGASLELMAGKKLPAVEVLLDK